mmetsp:Transcript_8371/g.21446  ORF Transcript_8371/g.21446 Transcript_8371/m.21446 type:complete len:217 (-) Transcript_8371:346-996(-)
MQSCATLRMSTGCCAPLPSPFERKALASSSRASVSTSLSSPAPSTRAGTRAASSEKTMGSSSESLPRSSMGFLQESAIRAWYSCRSFGATSSEKKVSLSASRSDSKFLVTNAQVSLSAAMGVRRKNRPAMALFPVGGTEQRKAAPATLLSGRPASSCSIFCRMSPAKECAMTTVLPSRVARYSATSLAWLATVPEALPSCGTSESACPRKLIARHR